MTRDQKEALRPHFRWTPDPAFPLLDFFVCLRAFFVFSV